MGKVIGKELKALGMNMDFAPILDINSYSENPVIGNRAFGSGPETVAGVGVQTL